ncbi:MAG: alpha/beta fold hydrolase [Candidatus Margulisiibacteriota bacterium]|jgi:pimeloyl-[acyl-carrier protein] methyl ester esterase
MHIVFLPGWSFGPGVFSELINNLNRNRPELKIINVDIYAINQYHLDSRLRANDATAGQDNRAEEPYSLAKTARLLAADLRELNDELIIIGWSLGGSIALELSQDQELKIRQLVLVSSTAKFINEGEYLCGMSPVIARSLRQRVVKDAKSGLEYFYGLVFSSEGPFYNEIASSMTPRNDGVGSAIPSTSLLQSLDALYQADYRSVLPTTSVPTTIIHGADDSICPLAAAEYLHQNLPSSKLAVIEQGGHIPFVLKAEAFRKVLLENLC